MKISFLCMQMKISMHANEISMHENEISMHEIEEYPPKYSWMRIPCMMIR